jgi:hypothetical protein
MATPRGLSVLILLIILAVSSGWSGGQRDPQAAAQGLIAAVSSMRLRSGRSAELSSRCRALLQSRRSVSQALSLWRNPVLPGSHAS